MPKYINADEIPSLFNEEYKRTRKLIEQGEYHLDNLAEGFLEAQKVISQIHAADVVEVVRCKDCKHFEPDIQNSKFGVCCKLVINNCGMEFCETDYCSYAERRESKIKRCFGIPKEVAEMLLEDTEQGESE